MVSVRSAVESDAEILCSFDHIAQVENERREFIHREIAAGNCFAAATGGEVVGYSVLNYSFYHFGCVEMLYVRTEYRRRGIGETLLRHMESFCKTAKLFTSTNLSNLRMQMLLAKNGYELSGVIHNLDEGDPEIVYFNVSSR